MNKIRKVIRIFGSLALIRAESPEEQAGAYKAITGAFIGGVIMFLAKPIAIWLLGGDALAVLVSFAPIGISTCTAKIPADLCTIVGQLLSLLQFLGVVAVVGGFIWGGIKLERNAGKREEKS